MSPERIVAAVLFALAAALVALVVLGPTEGADATVGEAATPVPETSATTEAATSTEAVATEPPAETTTEAVEAPTSTEAVPAKPPRPLAGDGTFPKRVRMTLDDEYDWKTAELDRRAQRLQVEARVTALQGGAGDDHGLECGTPEATYAATIDPWTGSYFVLRWNSTRSSGYEMGRGAAAALVRPPKPNVLRLTCVTLSQGGRIVLAANGKRIASIEDNAVAGGFGTIGLTANDVGGGQDVVFDGVLVETG